MSKLDDALKRFTQVGLLGMRDSDYRQVSDSLAWFREDLAVIKNELLKARKEHELLGLYIQYYNKIPIGTSMYKVELEIEKLEKEIEDKQ